MFAQGVLGSAVVNTATQGAQYLQTTGSLFNDPSKVGNNMCREGGAVHVDETETRTANWHNREVETTRCWVKLFVPHTAATSVNAAVQRVVHHVTCSQMLSFAI